jgi:hypothetical protein
MDGPSVDDPRYLVELLWHEPAPFVPMVKIKALDGGGYVGELYLASANPDETYLTDFRVQGRSVDEVRESLGPGYSAIPHEMIKIASALCR